MAYGKVKADAFVYDNSGTDVEVALSGIPSTSDLNAKAPLASPNFTGIPLAPTAAQGTNTTQLATTAFVNAEIAADIATKADLAGPTFTGVPAAPTASAGTNTTQLATTAFVQAEGFAKTSVAQTYTAAQRAEVTTLNFAATMTPNFADSNNFSVTLTGAGRIANPTNQVAGQSGSIFITQDGTGSRVLSWGDSGGTSAWYWAGGTAPTLSTGANVKDRVDYIVAANGVIHAVATLAVSANTP
tara:strand:- start:920 stop:1648 length:729 start_codon:yes stop_codon:yes gene_type:complete